MSSARKDVYAEGADIVRGSILFDDKKDINTIQIKPLNLTRVKRIEEAERRMDKLMRDIHTLNLERLNVVKDTVEHHNSFINSPIKENISSISNPSDRIKIITTDIASIKKTVNMYEKTLSVYDNIINTVEILIKAFGNRPITMEPLAAYHHSETYQDFLDILVEQKGPQIETLTMLKTKSDSLEGHYRSIISSLRKHLGQKHLGGGKRGRTRRRTGLRKKGCKRRTRRRTRRTRLRKKSCKRR